MTQIEEVPSFPARLARCPGCTGSPCHIKRWELLELAAEGSWSRVYRARPLGRDADLPAAYAVKRLRPEFEDDPRAAALLEREALVGRSVSHPHLLSILGAEFRRAPRLLIMPWLEGQTLQRQIETGRTLDLPEAVWYVRQAAEALDALHRAGWMHGDVKPDNLMLSPEGHVTLLDLSFARRTDEAADRWVLGTCNYLAPEWLTSALRPDIRSDIYSLGVTLFELLTGRLPFAGGTLAELSAQHRQAAPPRLRRVAPYMPREAADLVHQMLAKHPLRRPQTPRELIDRLAELEIEGFSARSWG